MFLKEQLVRLHIQLAQAVNALKAAEKALEEARKKESQTRTAINKKVREYNAMIRAGADVASLTAKLAEVNAQEDAARLATQERIRQEELVATLEEQVALLQEAVELRERLVQQLLDITKEQIIKIEVDTSGAESALGDFLENFDWGIPTGRIWPTSGAEVGGHPDFQPENKAFQAWNAALAEARTAMENWEKEMGSLFDPLTGPGGSIAKMTKAWEGLTKLFGIKARDRLPPFDQEIGKNQGTANEPT